MRYRVFLDKRAQKQLESLNDNNYIKEKIIKPKEGFIPEFDIKKALKIITV